MMYNSNWDESLKSKGREDHIESASVNELASRTFIAKYYIKGLANGSTFPIAISTDIIDAT